MANIYYILQIGTFTHYSKKYTQLLYTKAKNINFFVAQSY